jgi:dynein heavy chain, axonemal
VVSTLENIKGALKGEILFSFELEESLTSMTIGKVPNKWLKVSYPSLKPLASYIDNLKERIKFFSNWVEIA